MRVLDTHRNKNLIITQLNARIYCSMKPKLTEITHATHTQHRYQAIQETWLKNDEQARVSQYAWIGNNRTERQGGGSGMLISNIVLTSHNRKKISTQRTARNHMDRSSTLTTSTESDEKTPNRFSVYPSNTTTSDQTHQRAQQHVHYRK